jgi:hypothetical protein
MASNTIRGVVVYFQNTTATGQPLPPPPFPAFMWDAVTDVNVTYPTEVSRHPIQAGASDVVDNIHTGPAQIAVSGIVSDSPLNRPVKVSGLNVDGSSFSSDLAVAMEQLLLGYRASRRRLIVASSRGTWSPCVISGGVNVKWGPQLGGSLEISTTFMQIRIARQQLVPAVADADVQAAGFSDVNIGTWTPGGLP